VGDWTNHRYSSGFYVLDHTVHYKEVSKEILPLLLGVMVKDFQENDKQ